MKFANIKFYISALVFIFVYIQTNADQEQCLETEIKKACDQLASINMTDMIDLGNGRVIPACMSNGLRAAKVSQIDNQNAKELQQILEELENDPPLKMTPEFREMLYQNWEDFTDFLLFSNDQYTIPWPPNSKNPKKTEVTRKQLIDWLGADRYEVLVNSKSLQKNGRSQIDWSTQPKIIIRRIDKNERERIFQFSKSAVLADLNQSSENQLNDRMLTKILSRSQDVTLWTPEQADQEVTECRPFGIAANNFRESSIGFEESRLALAPVESIRTLAHEITHSHDQCRMQQYLVKNKKSSEKFLFTKGKVREDEIIIDRPLPVRNYPFRNVVTCLQSEDGGNFKEKGFKQQVFDNQPEGACTYGQINEAFCDWAGAKAVAKYLSEKKSSPPPSYQISFQTPAKGAKIVTFPPKLAESFYYVDKICEENYDRSDWSDHPTWRNRFLKIYAREPKIAQALGCGPANHPPCSNSPNMTLPVEANEQKSVHTKSIR